VAVPAYRDPEAAWTLRDLFLKAARPDRVHAGVVWQASAPGRAGAGGPLRARSHTNQTDGRNPPKRGAPPAACGGKQWLGTSEPLKKGQFNQPNQPNE
jgi:hypothetical protein